jgi:biopolymer transport protein ExbB/TolQ
VTAIVILALALAVMSLAMVVVALRELLRVLRRLRASADTATQRLRPLRDELQAEAAVSATEAEALQERLARVQESRGRRGRRKGGTFGLPGTGRSVLP